MACASWLRHANTDSPTVSCCMMAPTSCPLETVWRPCPCRPYGVRGGPCRDPAGSEERSRVRATSLGWSRAGRLVMSSGPLLMVAISAAVRNGGVTRRCALPGGRMAGRPIRDCRRRSRTPRKTRASGSLTQGEDQRLGPPLCHATAVTRIRYLLGAWRPPRPGLSCPRAWLSVRRCFAALSPAGRAAISPCRPSPSQARESPFATEPHRSRSFAHPIKAVNRGGSQLV